jgi:ankyrin repeat protein
MTEQDQSGRLPLHYAAMANDVRALRECLEAGDDPNQPDDVGFAPLHMAAQHGSLDAARVLLDSGAQVDAPNDFGNTPLFVAVFNSRGRGDLIGLLRERGADPLRANTSGQTPVGLARLIANYPVAQYFEDLPD